MSQTSQENSDNGTIQQEKRIFMILDKRKEAKELSTYSRKPKRTKLNNKSQATLESANATKGGRNKKKGKAKKRTFVELTKKNLLIFVTCHIMNGLPKTNGIYLREY